MKSRAASSFRPRRSARAPDVTELNFNDDRVPPRTGDPVSPQELRALLPRRRVRQAGLTGAAVSDDVTADDLSPETLIDEEGSDSTVRRRRGPIDTLLRRLTDEELRTDPNDPAADVTGEMPDKSIDR